MSKAVSLLEQILEPFIKGVIHSLRRLIAIVVLPVPGPFKIILIREGENQMLIYKAAMPKPPFTPGDITTQRFYGPDGTATDLPLGTAEAPGDSPEFSVTEGATVTIGVSYVDNAGNEGPKSSQTFIGNDTIPPDAPGPFGEVTLMREE